jgi:hypothetical protein
MAALVAMIAGVKESWDRLNAEREALMQRFRAEFGHEPKGEAMPHHFEEEKNKIFDELDKANASTYQGDKHQETIDRIIGKSKARGKVARGMKAEEVGIEPTKRGRPKGSKNKPKPQVAKASEIGYVPKNDLILGPALRNK